MKRSYYFRATSPHTPCAAHLGIACTRDMRLEYAHKDFGWITRAQAITILRDPDIRPLLVTVDWQDATIDRRMVARSLKNGWRIPTQSEHYAETEADVIAALSQGT